MAYLGFSGSGTVGNFASTTILETMYPAVRYAGRRATVETGSGTVTPYFSNGSSWLPEANFSVDTSGNVTGLVDGRSVGTPHMSSRPLGAIQETRQGKSAA